MPTDAAFRRSLYLMLALACVCVGYAEHAAFPEVPVVAGVAVAALAALYRLETRVELLSIPDANRLGLVVGLLNLGWAAIRTGHSFGEPHSGSADIQFTLIAMLGLLLVTLIPAKLARREKHVGDFWTLQGLGLVAAVLSGAVSETPVCFALVGLYAPAAVWCLSLFHLRRAAGAVPPIPNQPVPKPVAGVLTADEPRTGLRWALALTALAATLAAPLYLITPRSSAEKLDLGGSRVRIGYSAAQMTDLNETGTLEANPAPAFEVEVAAQGGTLPELPSDVRWRGRVLRQYARGTWEAGEVALPGMDAVPLTQLDWNPPPLRPGELAVTYAVPPTLAAQPLAEPVRWEADGPVPVATSTPTGWQPWLWVGDGSFYWPGRVSRRSAHRYVQRMLPDREPDLGTPFHITDPDPGVKLRALSQNPVPAVKRYADELLDAYVRDGKLPTDFRDPVTMAPRGEYHDRIARRFCEHLATAPDFTYTTVLRRDRKDLDPVEEFLLHGRAGHCERFASALALMLRSQGIPAVLVLGFKGCEPTGVPGRFVVRHEHAHAWVDALIVDSQPVPAGQRGRPVSRWRTLDPTPAGSPTTAVPTETWAGGTRAWVQGVFHDYVTHYSPERRRKALAAIGAWLLRPVVIGCAIAVAVVVLVARRLPVRSRTPAPARAGRAPGSGSLEVLLALLARHGFVPRRGDTPREFASAVGEALALSPTTASVAGVPGDWVAAYYEARFGGVNLPPERLAALEAGLRELERRLTLPVPSGAS